MRTLRSRTSAAILIVLAVGASVAMSACGGGGGAGDNVIILLLDTVRLDALGCYGNPYRPTPNIDAIAAAGVRFTQAISTSGWTLPAVGSLLTGAWPIIHGGSGRGTNLKPIRDELPTAAEVMRRAGFNTLGFANAAFLSPMVGLDRGFDLFDHRFTYNSDTRRADETIDAALGALRRHRTKRNFVLIHLFDPHLDYDPPGPYRSRYTPGERTQPPCPLTFETCLEMRTGGGDYPPKKDDIDYIRGVYYGEVGFMDEQIGRLKAELETLGMYDRTTLIVVADHGEEFWDHGGFEHGHTLYDELVRIPLIIKFPVGTVDAAAPVVTSQVRIIDIMPTVFDLLDTTKPSSFAGESLLPIVEGAQAEDRFALSEGLLYGKRKISWRTGRYKYIHHLEREGVGELYDWRADPGEINNLAAERPDLAAKYRADLLDFYLELSVRARNMSDRPVVDMSPERIEKLRSLGYIR